MPRQRQKNYTPHYLLFTISLTQWYHFRSEHWGLIPNKNLFISNCLVSIIAQCNFSLTSFSFSPLFCLGYAILQAIMERAGQNGWQVSTTSYWKQATNTHTTTLTEQNSHDLVVYLLRLTCVSTKHYSWFSYILFLIPFVAFVCVIVCWRRWVQSVWRVSMRQHIADCWRIWIDARSGNMSLTWSQRDYRTYLNR